MSSENRIVSDQIGSKNRCESVQIGAENELKILGKIGQNWAENEGNMRPDATKCDQK